MFALYGKVHIDSHTDRRKHKQIQLKNNEYLISYCEFTAFH